MIGDILEPSYPLVFLIFFKIEVSCKIKFTGRLRKKNIVN